jgi:phospholipid/cholesterol/gamma-HCH transport system ATP-binding protein
MENSIIVAKGLSKQFGKHVVLSGVNLEIQRGKITVLMGLSGTGKSVLLKHILGLLQPDSGSLFVDGVDVVHARREERRQVLRKIGMCYQNSALFDSMTARENVAFPLREHMKLEEAALQARVDEVLGMVGLSNIGNKNPSELSGGMRKRVGLARALVINPEIVMFDEPTTGLDPILSDVIGRTIVRTHDKYGYTCLIVSHELKLTFTIADYVALLLKGKIAFYGTPEEFKNSPDEAVQQFIAGRAAPGPIEVQ